MGYWNAKPFGNDGACDWLYILEKAKDQSCLEKPLRAAVKSSTDPELDDCIEGIAAAEIIQAARHEPVAKIPTEARRWVLRQGFSPTNSILKLAIEAVSRIVQASELRSDWKASPKWLREQAALLARLRAALKLPQPKRSPKPPAERLTLAKLLESISLADKGERRSELRKRLLQLKDVNKAFPGFWGTNEEGIGIKLNPLSVAVSRGLVPEASILLERGANPQLALREAVRSGNVRMIELLVRYGARLELRAYTGRNALHHTALAGKPAVIRWLVEKGLPLNGADEVGCTPLHLAVLKESRRAVQALLSLHADVNVRDKQGETALDVASDCFPKLASLLRRHGALNSKELGRTANKLRRTKS